MLVYSINNNNNNNRICIAQVCRMTSAALKYMTISVAMRFGWGGIFNVNLIANLPESVPVKEFWKSVDYTMYVGECIARSQWVSFLQDTVYMYGCI